MPTMDFLTFTGLILVCTAIGGVVKILKDISTTLKQIESKMPITQG